MTSPLVAPLTQHYAEFIAGTRPSQVPAESLAVARLGFSDCAGVILAGRDEEVVQRVAHFVREQGGKPESRLALGSDRASMIHAGLVGGTASHALDYDDFAFSNHPSAVLVPAIMAAADATGADGARMATAYLVGYEIWADIMLRERDLFYDRGWHPTAVLGPIGAAAAVAVMLGLDVEGARNALALAASDAGGVFENFGTMAKPWHGGRTAAAGLSSASLAAAGLIASPTALEGHRGLLRALSPNGNVDLTTPPQLGKVWRSAAMKLNIKKYPVVGAAQRGIDAVLAMQAVQRVDPKRVRSVEAHISLRHAAVMPYHLPQDALQAKFSLEFAVASALVYGGVGFDQMTDATVRDPLVQSIMKGVSIVTTEEFEPEWRDAAPFDLFHFTLDDGAVVSTPKVRRPKGHFDTPLSTEELWAKFRGCALYGGVNEGAARELFDVMQRIDSLAGSADIPVMPRQDARPG